MADIKEYETRFIEFAMSHKVLKFGQFTLKSGRQSPYFFNAGEFNTGAALSELGGYYAAAIQDSQLQLDVLFGPAYKGIPLVTSTAIAMYSQFQRDLPYAFNRKEAKDHGEGGTIVGAPLRGKVLIVDDVITAGTAIRESVKIIQALGAEPVGVVVAIDRQEKGRGELSSIQEFEQEFGIPVKAVITLDKIMMYLGTNEQYSHLLTDMEVYREQYAARY
ncbi:hypothetical protein H4R33_000021 [Dimargaris cristalligena]|uniref:orotate phosphoribosyltransferase n=1 Tax=Dimargaris cristalligena TaxID=215637 RepID=A0A4V1J5K8_9FUNG|nr:hypothetical protein H4R33_000021 [Dimargaris cristalligena]RKP39409.1 orotate phosphoribosyltransferase [Dimargaris cristalligena]|eukprot:RKP39409.1 orotate phosphoribosyltransferase [Dimargaris cristalligena]